MCPCVLLEKFKRAVNKGKRSKRDGSSESSGTGESVGEESKAGSQETARSTAKKSAKSKEKSKKNVRKKDESTCSVASLSSEPSKEQLNVVTAEKLGQVTCRKQDPKDFLKRVLESERPDLFERVELTLKQYGTIEKYLVRQGEMRIGVDLQLGKITDCDNDSSKVGRGKNMTVVQMYASGRFGAVYLVERDDSGKSVVNIPRGLALKTGRRLGTYTKIEDEIRILRRLCRQDNSTDLKNVPRITHITPMFFNGIAGGISYFLMPMMDANLTKIRQETGYKLPWTDAFYIAQEVMIAIRQCHEHSIVHRDIKPTNLLLNSNDNRTWWLCDFGDACRIGERKKLSPPDALTLPFVSRAGHRAMTELIPATIGMDIESWFYLLLELFVALPWNNLVEEEETLESKNAFWTSPNTFLDKHGEKLPPQVRLISQVVADATIEKPHGKLQALLRDGYTKYNTSPPWKPLWAEKRPVKLVQTPVNPPQVKLKTVIPKAMSKEGATPVAPSPASSSGSKTK